LVCAIVFVATTGLGWWQDRRQARRFAEAAARGDFERPKPSCGRRPTKRAGPIPSRDSSASQRWVAQRYLLAIAEAKNSRAKTRPVTT
jgi:hypothetical protein